MSRKNQNINSITKYKIENLFTTREFSITTQYKYIQEQMKKKLKKIIGKIIEKIIAGTNAPYYPPSWGGGLIAGGCRMPATIRQTPRTPAKCTF